MYDTRSIKALRRVSLTINLWRIAWLKASKKAIQSPKSRRKDKVWPARYPPRAINGDAAARHDHVDMGMMRQRRAPGVKHRGDADAGAEVLGIGRDGSHGLGRGREQDVVDRGLVLIGDIRDGGRQREHHMKLRHRQQIGLARGEPFPGGRALTLRTMAITTAVVGNDRVRAIFAAGVKTDAARASCPIVPACAS